MTYRNRELAFLVGSTLAVALGYATVFLAQSKVIDATGLAYGAFFLALFLLAHVAVRIWAPLADSYLLPITALLGGIGVIEVFRLKPDLANQQALWLVVGVASMFAVMWGMKDYRVLERYKYVIGVGGLLVLLATALFGAEVNGSRLWLRIPHLVQIQPGEFAKIGIVIFLAAYLRENRELLRMSWSPKYTGPLLLVWGLSLVLFVRMNDFGTSLLFYLTFLLMVYVATSRLGYLLAGMVAFVAGSYAVYHVAAHVQQRFNIWLDPFKTAQSTGYQLVQGLYALADGGVFGRGLGQAYLVTSNGNTLIPDAHTDFIFAAIGDELGFMGSVGVLLLYVLFAWRGFAIAEAAPDGFSKLLAFGLTTAFTLQAIIIVGGVVRLLPLTGQTLPFVSYGGSSILANFLLVTLLLMVSHHVRASHVRSGALSSGGGAR